METTLDDIHPHIIQTHILPQLDGRSLFLIATKSSYRRVLSWDHNLWSRISKCTWPSLNHPRVDKLITSFPGGHRSFFLDSFPSLITEFNKRSNSKQPHSYPRPSILISAVDIHYQTNVIYSTVQFTGITNAFLSSSLLVKIDEDAISKWSGSKPVIDLEVNEIHGVDETILSHLKESLTLSWILIDPSLKRACNLSSIKPSTVKKDWITNDIVLQYTTILPGCDPNEMVQCRLNVVLGKGNHEKGLHVKEVSMTLMDLDSYYLNGKDFLVISQRAILLEDNAIRKVLGDEERLQNHREFKEMKRQRRIWVRRGEKKRKYSIIIHNFAILMWFCFSVLFWSL